MRQVTGSIASVSVGVVTNIDSPMTTCPDCSDPRALTPTRHTSTSFAAFDTLISANGEKRWPSSELLKPSQSEPGGEGTESAAFAAAAARNAAIERSESV